MLDMLRALFELQWDLEQRARTSRVITQLHKGGDKPATRADSLVPPNPAALSLTSAATAACLHVSNRLSNRLEGHDAQNAFCPGRD
jgi:hypothetical protein